MDELKLLIDMVANLPTLAVWVLVGYLAYKVVVVGSIYGVIRLLIIKGHDGAAISGMEIEQPAFFYNGRRAGTVIKYGPAKGRT